MHISPSDILEWTGCITGAVGSIMLAARHSRAAWAFVLYLVSSCYWITYGVITEAPGLITMQLVFVGTALVGIYNWLIIPQQKANLDKLNSTQSNAPTRNGIECAKEEEVDDISVKKTRGGDVQPITYDK